MKTTKQIINDELGVILNSVDYDLNNVLFEINKNKKWYSEEEFNKSYEQGKKDERKYMLILLKDFMLSRTITTEAYELYLKELMKDEKGSEQQ